MKERIETFGPGRCLVGVLTEPPAGQVRDDAPAFLLWNVGIQSRVGPRRIWVELARKLAEAGFRTLRFDLSGFGDSAPRAGGGTEEERALLDVQDAMDWIGRRFGIDRFVVVGFCSGTDVAHAVACKDPRVQAMIWIEGYAYKSQRFLLHWHTTRYLSGARWRTFAWSALARLVPRYRPRRSVGEEDLIFERPYPPREQLAVELDALVRRGVEILAVYSGGSDYVYGYEGQFYDMLPIDFRGRIDVAYYAEADHLFSGVASRRQLIEEIVGWSQEKFPSRRLLRSAS